ncbi:hypothetical protein SAMN05421763_11718 [[Luteovulum] sphaeroides subsp. megalophilum]|uniref:hypothetical protein n=1 Tax=Cereibacter sphaeroides TaxID=1063 RepID=UPI000B64B89A|nr:hypothetical protein [Cereibacter sphaeroides]SNT42203.1 hypothetical protein SAMN05421763_11718 [[Luteovulum] sphaeroides subsp. megalophilum]
MQRIAMLGAFLLIADAAFAGCVGSETFQSCWDDAGNSYTVSRYGNTTHLEGSNTRTGSHWSQESQTLGNTTYHQGRSADGGNWNMTQQSIGGSTFYSGRDSDGKAFSGVCGPFGCD